MEIQKRQLEVGYFIMQLKFGLIKKFYVHISKTFYKSSTYKYCKFEQQLKRWIDDFAYKLLYCIAPITLNINYVNFKWINFQYFKMQTFVQHCDFWVADVIIFSIKNGYLPHWVRQVPKNVTFRKKILNCLFSAYLICTIRNVINGFLSCLRIN